MRIVAVKRSLNEYMITKEIGSRTLRSRAIGLTTSLVCIGINISLYLFWEGYVCETPDRHSSLGMMIDMCVYT